MREKNNKRYTKDEALVKLQIYCSYQDRCHYEVRSKLLELKIYGDELEEIMSDLISEEYLDEERYARSYARGKFRIKKWGRIKITQELKRRHVSAYCIKKGLSEIESDVYNDTADGVIRLYYSRLSGKIPIKKNKSYTHGIRRGYESALVLSILQQIISEEKDKL